MDPLEMVCLASQGAKYLNEWRSSVVKLRTPRVKFVISSFFELHNEAGKKDTQLHIDLLSIERSS